MQGFKDVKHFPLLWCRFSTLEEMIAKNKFIEVNSNITSENFTVTSRGSFFGHVILVKLGYRCSGPWVIDRMAENNLVPSPLEVDLRFVRKHPHLQEGLVIVNLKTIGRHKDGQPRVVRFDGSKDKRTVNLAWPDKDFPEHCYFTALQMAKHYDR